jgi:hypothetical protein
VGRFGSDSEELAASITSPLVLKQPTQALMSPEVRVGPEAVIPQDGGEVVRCLPEWGDALVESAWRQVEVDDPLLSGARAGTMSVGAREHFFASLDLGHPAVASYHGSA